MDLPLDPVKWQPTKPPEPGDAQLSPTYISSLCRKLNQQTKAIVQHPYDPDLWLHRAITLSRLRYPELAVGDAHKAQLLCQAHLARLRERGGWAMGHRMGFCMFDDASLDGEREQALMDSLDNLLHLSHQIVTESTTPALDHDLEGRFRRRPYPWMREGHLRRSDELLEEINREFALNSVSMDRGAPDCVLKRHAFGEGVGYSNTSELLGVFATRNVFAGARVLVDTTRIWGCNGPGSKGDCMNLHGGLGCCDPLHPNAASDDTSLELRWIRDKAGKHAASILRNCKLLLCSVEDAIEHPLDHPLIARMTPNYAKDRISKFSLAHDIAIPNEALQQFGMDIFANPNYDTWVLFTIDARAVNNSCGDPTVELLNPLFSLFNHSCAPNIEWKISEDHQAVTVTACKTITEGEQMFVQYDGYLADQPLEERRKRLWSWLDGPCQCARCVEEERLRREGGHRLPEPTWDLSEKPVLPEDLLHLKN